MHSVIAHSPFKFVSHPDFSRRRDLDVVDAIAQQKAPYQLTVNAKDGTILFSGAIGLPVARTINNEQLPFRQGLYEWRWTFLIDLERRHPHSVAMSDNREVRRAAVALVLVRQTSTHEKRFATAIYGRA
jgi:hypothetical protein